MKPFPVAASTGQRNTDSLWRKCAAPSLAVSSGVMAGGRGDGQLPSPLILGCRNIVRKFSDMKKIFVQKCKIWDRKAPFWDNLGAKLKFSVTITPLSEICSSLSENFSFLSRLLFLTHDAAGCQQMTELMKKSLV